MQVILFASSRMGVGILGLKTTKSAHLIFGYSNKIDAVTDENSLSTLIVFILEGSVDNGSVPAVAGTVCIDESSHAVQ